MAAAWSDHPAFARWAEADDVLGRDVSRLGLEADDEELREPANCQVALFVHHTVLLDAWRSTTDAEPVAVAGHSLGEYNALVAAGALGFSDGLRLVDARARATQAAADDAPGTLVACLGYEVEEVAEACEQVGAHVANDNAPGQVVVAGTADALARLKEELERVGEGRRTRVMDVNVGAAYHSPHMANAVEPLSAALDAATFSDATVPVVANVDAAAHTAADEWPALLRDQVVSPVRWRESVTTFPSLGATAVVELGAKPVLSGMIKRIDRSIDRRTVATPEDLS